MGICSIKEIYQVLEQHLKSSDTSVTCMDLIDTPEVRSAVITEYSKDICAATNKVSDALGFMWRRNLLNATLPCVRPAHWRGMRMRGMSQNKNRSPHRLCPCFFS